MAQIQTTSNLSNSVRTRYTYLYREAAEMRRLYDLYSMAAGADKGDLEKREFMGSTVTYNFLSDMAPGTSAISQTSDISPQTLTDAVATVTPTSRADAIQWAEAVDIQAYTNYGASAHQKVGKASMESLEILAYTAALGGGLIQRAAARASLDAGTSGHRWTDSAIAKAAARVTALKCPPLTNPTGELFGGRPMLMATAHSDAFYDLFSGGNVVSVGQYQQKGLVFNPYNELGEMHQFKLMISPWAKVFGAAGADNGSNAATTLSAATSPLDLDATIASGTNIAIGQYITFGTEETGSTFYPTNELVVVSDDYTLTDTTLYFVGEAANGGLRFAHASGTGVRNADNVYPVVYGSNMSMVKIYARQIGPFAMLVGPKEDGIVNQFSTLGYKWYGGYGLIADNYIMRGEYSSSVQA
jgi:N4-gp56 family major capsid protein